MRTFKFCIPRGLHLNLLHPKIQVIMRYIYLHLHSSIAPAHRNTSAPMDVDFIVGMPFAVVGEISDNSPTAEDGLQLGDQIVKFGTLEYQSGENMLQKLASEALTNQGTAISLVVLRQGTPVNLTIMPREWQGRGLLGFSLRAL